MPVQRQALTATVVAQGSVEFASPRQVALAGTVGTPQGAGGQDGGEAVAQRVTRAPVAGSVLREGGALMEVSGRPVLVLKGAVPMYRALGPGSTGDDVTQLQQALRRLGFDPGAANGRYGQGTAAAVSRWYRSKGYEAEQPGVADRQEMGRLQQDVYAAQEALPAAEGTGGAGGGAGAAAGPGAGASGTSSGGAAKGAGGGSATGGGGQVDRLRLQGRTGAAPSDAPGASSSSPRR